MESSSDERRPSPAAILRSLGISPSKGLGQHFLHDAGIVRRIVESAGLPPNATVVEYYRAEVDHYFMTASPHEQVILDAGLQRGWVRTGRTFLAWTDPALAPSTAMPVCRFLGRPEAGLDSHFYSAFAS